MKFRKYDKRDFIYIEKICSQYWNDKNFLAEISEKLDSSSCNFYIVENEEKEILGFGGFRDAPIHLRKNIVTKTPAELYIIASKYKNKGVGSFLCEKIIEEAKKLNYTEMLCYSPETHAASWKFYENLGFVKLGIIKDPEDGFPGMLWQKIF